MHYTTHSPIGVTLIVHEPLPMMRVRPGADGALAVALTNPPERAEFKELSLRSLLLVASL
eukprot:13022_2